MLTEPPDGAPVEPAGLAADPDAAPPPETGDGRIIGGVAFELAARVGVDPLWVRLAFVTLALASGLGVILYAGLWLILIIGPRPGWAALRWVGAGVLLVGVLLLLDGHTDLMEGPLVLAAVLVGVAVALWQPRGVLQRVPAVEGDVPPSLRVRDVVTWRPRDRESSVLGRATLGVALVAAAAGALIDQLNDGRLHPEQWLGAAAAVCGAGLLLGAWRGRALWLVVPGLAFAGAGYVAGHGARAGVEEWGWGSSHDVIGPGFSAQPLEHDHVAGDVNLDIIGPPDATPQSVDLRMGIGEIHITADRDVTVEIRPELRDGDVHVDGTRRAGGDESTFTVGPEGDPDVIVDATISIGDLFVRRVDVVRERPPIIESAPPWLEDIPNITGVIDIGEGVTMASDGTVLLPDRAGAIGPNGQLWVPGDAFPRGDGLTAVPTEFGEEFLVLPNQMIITPSGTLIDVPALREEFLGAASPSTLPTDTTTPTTED